MAKSEANITLYKFIHHIGVPGEILTDGAQKLYKIDWRRTCVKHSIIQDLTKPDTPKQEPAKIYDGILKKMIPNRMQWTNTPVQL